MIIGDAITAGGGGGGSGDNTILAAIIGTINSSTYKTVGTGTVSHHVEDAEYFTYSEGVFTCNVAGTYTFDAFIRSSYATGYASVYAGYRARKNDSTNIGSISNTQRTDGYHATYTADLAVGDTVSIEMLGYYSDAGTNRGSIIDGGLFISM